VIVVISEYSIDKPWVREELNASMVRRINGISKLIPVIIGDLDESRVPESLKSIVWEHIEALDSYDKELERITMAIYGHREKPPIGSSPVYAQVSMKTLPNLTEVDSLILKICCEELIRGGQRFSIVNPQALLELAETSDIYPDSALESLEILDGRGYVRIGRVLSGDVYHISVTDYGLEEYLEVYVRNYESIFRNVGLQIANLGRKSNNEIAEALDQPQVIVDHILSTLDNRGHIRLQKIYGGSLFILSVSPELKRSLS
jgi:hypothetical protein